MEEPNASFFLFFQPCGGVQHLGGHHFAWFSSKAMQIARVVRFNEVQMAIIEEYWNVWRESSGSSARFSRAAAVRCWKLGPQITSQEALFKSSSSGGRATTS